MARLGDLYTDFTRIDLDTRGGFARVAQVKTHGQKKYPTYCAFKLMRHDLESPEKGIDRFEGEVRTLIDITLEKNHPQAITKIYDCGFAAGELSNSLQKPLIDAENTRRVETVDPEIDIISTGADLQKFKNLRSELMSREPNHWLPYIVVELAPYDDNLLRQIRTLSSAGNSSDLYRLPVREIIAMGLQILELMDYLHREHGFA
jgi:serine/threonine protein kinase